MPHSHTAEWCGFPRSLNDTRVAEIRALELVGLCFHSVSMSSSASVALRRDAPVSIWYFKKHTGQLAISLGTNARNPAPKETVSLDCFLALR